MTAKEILDNAGYLLGIKRQGIDLEEEEYSQGVGVVNRIFTNLNKRGYRLGFQGLKDKFSDTKLPAWAELFAINQTAIDWSAFFQLPISESIVAAADRGFKAIESNARMNDIPTAFHPRTPMGMNNRRSAYRQNRFYGNRYRDLVYNGNNILLGNEGKPVISKRKIEK